MRRIEAITNQSALSYLNKIQEEAQLAKTAASLFEKWDTYLSSEQFELPGWIESRKNEIKDLEKLNTELDAQTNKILDYLKTQNIKQENIQTNKNSYNDYVYMPIKGDEAKPQDNIRNLSTQFIVKFVDYASS